MLETKFSNYSDNVIGWIEIFDTSISYPIVKTNDNKSYLNKNYLGEYSVSGSIFMDYRNDITDNYIIIYGHNLKNGGMFSDIRNYNDKEYFDNHLKGKLYFRNDEYDINVISYNIVNHHDLIYDVNNYKNNNSVIINHLLNKNLNYEKVMIMSTCSSGGVNERIILLCELKKSS